MTAPTVPLRHADRTVLAVEAVAASWSRRGTLWPCLADAACITPHVMQTVCY
ncbi:hypothetical protein ABJI51_16745 [Amycolatopsis sp. NEAU-NG30]|uniref:Uncharacterized protein n=1 Tax=Amycolatopsis melonis TaxID=3156488 RepID=A0ABV0LEZ0_9PSEU